MRQRRIVWLTVCLSVVLAFLIGCGQGSLTKKELKTEKTAVNLVREVNRGGYEVIDTPELKAWIDDNKDMLIIDTMPFAASYKKNHIPKAVNFEFPIPEVKEMDEAKKAEFIKILGPDQEKVLVFYCGFTTCTRSHNGAMWAKKLGYKNVYRQPGGIKAWLEAKYPVEKAK